MMTSTAPTQLPTSYEEALRSSTRACPGYTGFFPATPTSKDASASPRCCSDSSCDASSHMVRTPSTDGSRSPVFPPTSITTDLPFVPRARSNSSPGSMPLKYTQRQSPLRSLSILPEDDMMSRSTPGLGSSSTTDEDSDDGDTPLSRSVGGMPLAQLDTGSYHFRSYSLGSYSSGRHSSLPPPPAGSFAFSGPASPPTGSFPLQYCSRKSPLRMALDTPPATPGREWMEGKPEDNSVGLGLAVNTPPPSPEIGRGPGSVLSAEHGKARPRAAGRR